MPHVVVKLWPGRTEQQKKRLTEAITKDVRRVFDLDEQYISIAFEEVDADEWDEKVYKPEILGKAKNLYKKPGRMK